MNVTLNIFNALAVKDPKQLYQISKAKKQYTIKHPECAICGNKKYLECHHVIPVHVDLSRSASYNNFIILCDPRNNGCHRWFGHFGDFTNSWNPKIREYAIYSRLFLQKSQPHRKFIVSTEHMIDEFSQAMNISSEKLQQEVNELINS